MVSSLEATVQDDDGSPDPSQPRRSIAFVAVGMLVLGAIVGTVFGATFFADDGKDRAVPATPAPKSALFVIDAESGWSEVGGEGMWRVHLREPSVKWFLDRPNRGTGTVRASRFVEAWPKVFPKSSPFGAVTAAHATAGHVDAIVELSKPQADAATRTLTFTVSPDANMSAATRDWITSLDKNSAKKRGRVAVFIDDGDADSIVYASTFVPFDSSF